MHKEDDLGNIRILEERGICSDSVRARTLESQNSIILCGVQWTECIQGEMRNNILFQPLVHFIPGFEL